MNHKYFNIDDTQSNMIPQDRGRLPTATPYEQAQAQARLVSLHKKLGKFFGIVAFRI